MARRHRKHRKSTQPTPEEVLGGHVDVRVGELFDLIHRINPTPHELPAAQARSRYEQKARLQSLLIRRFGDEVAVEPTHDEDVVSLSHRSGQRDACHARLSELEVDARSWVRHELDLLLSEEAPPRDAAGTPPADEPLADDDLVARAERAIEGYEYDVAEELLVRALGRRRDTVAARRLLELRVELLGMDEAALELVPRLPPRARGDARIRSLLALAAARLGERERALEWIDGVRGRAAAEVYATLADDAVRGGDRESAEDFSAELTAQDPSHPRISEIRRGLTALRAASVRPEEEALAELFARQGALAAEAEARDLLARWEHSEVARQVLREAAEARRRETLGKETARAEKALAAGRFRAAAEHLERAVEAGAEGLGERLAAARRRAGEEEAAASVERTVRALVEDEAAALPAYLGLPAELRERVRGRLERPPLAWLEETGAAGDRGERRVQAAVAAVLALARAAALLADGDAHGAREALAPHLRTLRPVDEAHRVLREADARIREERLERNRELLAGARRAVDEDGFDEAERLLHELDATLLDEDGRTAVEELEGRLEVHAHLVGFEETYARLLELGLSPRAADFAEVLGEEEIFGETVREEWRRRGADLRARVRAEWRLTVDTTERPLAELDDFRLRAESGYAPVWLDDEGRELVLLEAQILAPRVSARPGRGPHGSAAAAARGALRQPQGRAVQQAPRRDVHMVHEA